MNLFRQFVGAYRLVLIDLLYQRLSLQGYIGSRLLEAIGIGGTLNNKIVFHLDVNFFAIDLRKQQRLFINRGLYTIRSSEHWFG